MGLWLSIVEPTEKAGNSIVLNLLAPHICESEKGFVLSVKDGDILIECGFANKIEEAVIAFFLSEIVRAESKAPVFAEGYTYEEVDYRNIYYSDFGAVGDGITDDFYAIKAAHDYANEWGHTVNADSGKTYYFGKGSGSDTITINTNTNWAGAEFIFDDSEIKAESHEIDEKGYVKFNVTYPGDPEFYTSVFTIENPNARRISYGVDDEKPITSVSRGAENIGFAPGFRAMVVLYDSNIHRFIRYGSGATFLKDQQEIVIVSADGVVDTSTPIQWDYDAVTAMEVIEMEDAPIVINGGEGDERAVIKTLHITSPYSCAYTKRNIYISRANVTVKNIEHTFDDYSWSEDAFYSGFFSAKYCDNLVIESSVISASSGANTYIIASSYELNLAYSSNVKIKDIQQSNFFEFNAPVASANYVKNTSYENVKLHNVHAGPGTYNLTVSDSVIDATSIVGEGDLIFENVTVCSNKGIVFNNVYGSTWRGRLKIDGLTLKFEFPKSNHADILSIDWRGMDYGIDAGLPDVVEISNVSIIPITVQYQLGTRYELVNTEHAGKVYACFCDSLTDESYEFEFSEPGVIVMKNSKEKNTYTLTEELYITDSPGLLLNVDPEIFKDMKIYVDGEEYEWISTGKVEIAKDGG